jgi:hypothetical protein
VSNKLDKKRARREAEIRKQQEMKRQARRRNLITSLTALVVVALVVVLVLVQRGSQQTAADLSSVDYKKLPTGLPGIMTGQPPWPANNGTDLRPRLDKLGFPSRPMESLDFHIHAHLDLFVHGSSVPLPANVGIDANQQFLTVLHTHATDGIVHIESPIQTTYGLGQFFDVWGLKLSKDCIGGLCSDSQNTLSAYVDGKKFSGDPRFIPLKSHEEIVLAYGSKDELPNPIPKSFNFPAGD